MNNSFLSKLLIAGLLLALYVRVYLIPIYQVNWDEFFFLSKIYDYLRGDVLSLLQSIHVHLFSWLKLVPGHEIGKIITARSVMGVLQFFTGLLLFKIGRLYFSRNAALFAVLSYFSFSFIIVQGTSFRSDPIITFLLILSIYLILRDGNSKFDPIISGLLISLSCMVTIKTVIYIPTIACIILIKANKSKDWSKQVRMVCYVVFSIILTGLFFYLFHKNSSETYPLSATVSSAARSFNKMFMHNRIFPGIVYLRYSLYFDCIHWIVLTVGFIIVVFRIFITDKDLRSTNLLVLAMTLPVTTLIFYRNSYPYYYPFIFAPACILCAVTWQAFPWKKFPKI